MKTRYRNTDLDLTSTFPLDKLNQKLEAAGMIVLGNHRGANDDWNVVLEIVGEENDRFHETFETTIIAMLDILEGLPEPERTSLDKCKVREFNTAYDVGDEPSDFGESLAAETLSRMAALKASFKITLYPRID